MNSRVPITNVESPSQGVCVVAACGRITATSEVASKWLDSGLHGSPADSPLDRFLATPPMKAALARVFAGAAELSICCPWPDDDQPAAQVQLYGIDGDAGRQAVVVVRFGPFGAIRSTDALTALPDRRALASSAGDWQRDPSGEFALLFLDLDDFKRVNDQFGHSAGDLVLRELAARWLRCVREGDVVARYGGDEFVILLKHVAGPAEVATVLERLHEATEAAVELGDLPMRMTCTIGAAYWPRDGADLDELIAAADRDMYARKRASRPPARR